MKLEKFVTQGSCNRQIDRQLILGELRSDVQSHQFCCNFDVYASRTKFRLSFQVVDLLAILVFSKYNHVREQKK